MRLYFAVMAVLCLFFINGCAEIVSESDVPNIKSDGSSNLVKAQDLGSFVKVEVQPTSKPERYMVYFSWPKLEVAKRIRIRQEQVLTIVQPTQTLFNHEVDHDQTLTYTFDILDDASKVSATFSKLIKIPRDFVVREGQSQFTENQKLLVKRLFINSTVPLMTNGFDVEIITDQIISDKGIIESFPEGAKAASSVDGKSAGTLLIKSKSAIGQLKIFMRGQHGGDGQNGQPYSSRAADGAAPGAGLSECYCRYCPDLVLKTIESSSDLQPMACFCLENGNDGGSGANGEKGRSGGRAGNGGDAGTLNVEIQDGSDFLLQTDSQVGLAGIPGNGGPGQPGGIAQGTKTKCSGNLGTNGRDGQTGDRGPEGANGKKGITCVYIATEGKNDCF